MVALAAIYDVEAEPQRGITAEHGERLRREAFAVCSEYFTVAKAKCGDPHPRCPGCEVRELEQRDLVAELTVRWLCARRRQAVIAREARHRMLASQRQTQLPI